MSRETVHAGSWARWLQMVEWCSTWNSICGRMGFFSGNANILVVDIMLPIGLAEPRLTLIHDAHSGHFT